MFYDKIDPKILNLASWFFEFDMVCNISGRTTIGFSLASPDLVICAGSPDIPLTSYVDSPEFLDSRCHQKLDTSMELSFENGIDASQVKDTNKTPTVKFSTTLCQTFKEDLSPESSFELLPPTVIEDKLKEDTLLEISNNVGCTDDFVDGGSQMAGRESLKVQLLLSPLELILSYQKTNRVVISFVQIISSQDDGNPMGEGDYQKLLIGYENQRKELAEMRSAFEELKRQNQSKSSECQEAWKSLKELQNELMRKSMHVGSLGMVLISCSSLQFEPSVKLVY